MHQIRIMLANLSFTVLHLQLFIIIQTTAVLRTTPKLLVNLYVLLCPNFTSCAAQIVHKTRGAYFVAISGNYALG